MELTNKEARELLEKVEAIEIDPLGREEIQDAILSVHAFLAEKIKLSGGIIFVPPEQQRSVVALQTMDFFLNQRRVYGKKNKV